MTVSARLVTGSWEELGAHAALVRRAVFIEEQRIAESDEWDEHDEPSLHCVAFIGSEAVGTGRLLADGHIGRMAVLATHRRHGLGGRILNRLIDLARDRGDSAIRLNAQIAVLDFYRCHGFETSGTPYDELGIPHQTMSRTLWGGEVEVAQTRIPGNGAHFLMLRQWRPSRGHGGGVLILHGLGEYGGRYDALARWLCARGWQVQAPDHVGHGESDGERGVLPRDDQFRLDARQMLQNYARELGQAPLLLGHSMGGAMAGELAALDASELKGLILSSPALTLGLSPPQKMMAALLGRFAPEFTVTNGLDPAYLSHDPMVVAAYRQDRLVHDRVCARLLRWLQQAGATVRQAASVWSVPTLLMVAGDDRLVDPSGSRTLADSAPTGVIDLHWYPSFYHEIFNEISASRQQVLDDLDRWLLRRFPQGGMSRTMAG